MITFTVRQGPTPKPPPPHQKRSRPVPDIASTHWNGQDWAITSNKGATMDLARKLVAAGCPDQPWQAVGTDGQRRFFGNSLHRLATRTIVQGDDAPGPYERRYVPNPRYAESDFTGEEMETEPEDAEP